MKKFLISISFIFPLAHASDTPQILTANLDLSKYKDFFLNKTIPHQRKQNAITKCLSYYEEKKFDIILIPITYGIQIPKNNHYHKEERGQSSLSKIMYSNRKFGLIANENFTHTQSLDIVLDNNPPPLEMALDNNPAVPTKVLASDLLYYGVICDPLQGWLNPQPKEIPKNYRNITWITNNNANIPSLFLNLQPSDVPNTTNNLWHIKIEEGKVSSIKAINFDHSEIDQIIDCERAKTSIMECIKYIRRYHATNVRKVSILTLFILGIGLYLYKK
jgi:hypothetical protein